MLRHTLCLPFLIASLSIRLVSAQEPGASKWEYRPELLRPFWNGERVEGESVLFIRDAASGEGRASLFFPVRELIIARNSIGDVTYENGKDYVWKSGSREIRVPKGSRIPVFSSDQLRRPAKSQKYELTHRDGNGEIFFGGRLEYAEMQTCFTYEREAEDISFAVPSLASDLLPRTIQRLKTGQSVNLVTLGDSISAGANASALYDAAPFQPAYPELVRRHLAEQSRAEVRMTNLAVGGTDTGWGLTQLDKVLAAQPHLVLLAFGMNDSAGRSPESYRETTQKMIAGIREKLPECEFILVASMLGNRDWIRLRHEAFPQYRDALKSLTGPGVAVADLTAVWTAFLERKQDWDQTGNGVNHPNDFGHRVYAQVITTLLFASSPNKQPTTNVPWLSEVSVPPANAPRDRLGHVAPLLVTPSGAKVATKESWEEQRKTLRNEWLSFLGPMPDPRPALKLEVLKSEVVGAADSADRVVRELVRYEGEPGLPVEGYLLRPFTGDATGSDSPKRSGIVALHQTTNASIDEIAGVSGPDAMQIGLKLARRGFVVFCPRCFLWQDAASLPEAVAKHQTRHPKSLGMAKMLYDAMRGVDVLVAQPDVDPSRIGTVGHSLGAKEALYLAAFDDRVQVAVASEGGVTFRSTNWDASWYLGPAIRDEAFPLNHHQLLALIAPRPFLVLGGESGPGAADGDRSWPLLEAALPVWRLYGEPARLGLLNHHQGHSVSPESFERIAEWLETYLKVAAR